ncbi:MAG: RluA family pseudouridine synthase [Pseudomonadales bacterium]
MRIDEAAGQRIDNYLVRHLKGVPRSRIYQMIRKGEVRVNGGRIKPTYRLQSGDQVRIPPVRVAPADAQAFIGQTQLEAVAAAVRYEDDRLLVLDKSAGMAVHGGSGVSFGVIEALRRLRPGADLELVHRLDRDTSGCLLVTKRRSTLRALHELIRTGQLIKTYRVIAHGIWPEDLIRVDRPLTRYLTGSGERRVRGDATGKPSLTTFRVDAHATAATLLTAQLHTGRTHQIRVHCRLTGHSVVGDEKYASPEELAADQALGIHRLCLHASRIEIPWQHEPRVIESPVPADFLSAWRRFESASEDG